MPRLWKIGQKVAATRDIHELDDVTKLPIITIPRHSTGVIHDVHADDPDGMVYDVKFNCDPSVWTVRDSEVKRIT